MSARRNEGRRYVRRPRVGDRVLTRYGVSVVERVTGRGVVIDIRDEVGRHWICERDRQGWWVRVDAGAS